MIRPLLTLTFLAVAVSSEAGPVVITDGNFGSDDWRVQFDGSTANPNGDPSGVVQVPLGGNPGAFRETRSNGRNIAATSSSRRRIYHWNFYSAETHSPSANGAIDSLDYADDSILLASAAARTYAALKQDGFLYRSDQSFVSDSSGWERNELMGLVADDFTAFFDGNFISTAHPDFSEAGGPIEFGFIREHVLGPLNRVQNRTGVDNWAITLNTAVIPEPGSLVLAVVVVSGGLIIRGRCTNMSDEP